MQVVTNPSGWLVAPVLELPPSHGVAHSTVGIALELVLPGIPLLEHAARQAAG